MSDTEMLSTEELAQLLETIDTSVTATIKSLQPMLEKAQADPLHSDLDFSNGLSLLTIRPKLLLASIHQLVIMLGLRLTSLLSETDTSSTSDDENTDLPLNAFSRTDRPSRKITSSTMATKSISAELDAIREVMEKTKFLENKVAHQVKKLVTAAVSAEAAAKREKEREMNGGVGGDEDEDEDDTLAFKPNVAGLLSASSKSKDIPEAQNAEAGSSRRRRARSVSDEDKSDDEEGDGIYRAPRLGAIPYNEGRKESRRADRRAPALLSEFADSLTNAPGLESTSGLSVRPVSHSDHLRSNSTSAKRLAELQRMTEFEEENMTRLVMRKRDAKRREEDEEALMMGYGVGGGTRSRSRRQGGFEAELEGVLGDRGNSKGMWDEVGKGLGKREGMLQRSKKRGGEELGGGGGPKRRKFQAAVKRSKRG